MVTRGEKYRRVLRHGGAIALCTCGLLSILATGGGDGDGGAGDTPLPAPPEISQLRLASSSAAFMAGAGGITIGLEVAYTDSNADVATLWVRVADRAASSVALGASAQGTSGTITNSVAIATTASGAVAVEAWVVDGFGHSSNHLIETFTVLGGVTLDGLALSTGALGPGFDPAVRDYVSTAAFLEDSVTITPTLADPRATVSVNGVPAISGTATPPLPLELGATTVTVSITAEPGGGSASYTVRVTRLVAHNVWVAADDRILLLSPTGRELAVITSVFGEDRFHYGVDADVIAVDPIDGALWVADTNNDRVLKFGHDGTPLLMRPIVSPMAVWVDPRDRAVWTSEAAGPSTRSLVKLSSTGDELVRVAGFSSSVPSIDGDPLRGIIWVADDEANAVVRLSGTDTELVGYDAAAATGTYHVRITGFNEPQSVAVNPYDDTQGTGNVWVANRQPGAAVKLTSTGAEILRATVAGYELRRAAVNVLDGSVWVLGTDIYLLPLNLYIRESVNFSTDGRRLRTIWLPQASRALSLDPTHELIWFAASTRATAYGFDGTEITAVGMPGICQPVACIPNYVRDIAVQRP